MVRIGGKLYARCRIGRVAHYPTDGLVQGKTIGFAAMQQGYDGVQPVPQALGFRGVAPPFVRAHRLARRPCAIEMLDNV